MMTFGSFRFLQLLTTSNSFPRWSILFHRDLAMLASGKRALVSGQMIPTVSS
jgi:hypothetical protein